MKYDEYKENKNINEDKNYILNDNIDKKKKNKIKCIYKAEENEDEIQLFHDYNENLNDSDEENQKSYLEAKK